MQKNMLPLFDGLLWYLEARNWAFEKVMSSPHGSELFDLRMQHSLFFVNLMSAVDHVADHLKGDLAGKGIAFGERIKKGFGETDDYIYVREMRNAVVHRGFDLCGSAHSDQIILLVLCPKSVSDRNGKEYSCSLKYLKELAEKCRAVIDPVIADVLTDLNLCNVVLHKPELSTVMDATENSADMPDWAKALAKEALRTMDFDRAATALAASRVDKMRKLLASSG